MSLYQIVKEQLRKNKELKESGGYVGIPFPHRRLSDYFPSLQRGHSIGILGGTGVGKSRYGRYLGLYTPYRFYKETGYKMKIFYLPLEDSKEKVKANIICHYLKEQFNITISLQELQSIGGKSLPQFVMDALDEADKFFEEFEEIVTILDGYTQPSKIFEMLEYYLLQPEIGHIEEYEVDVLGRKEIQKRYISDLHVIVLLDNYSNIDLDGDHPTERAAVLDFAKNYGRAKLCNLYKCTLIQVLQTDFATERQQFSTSDGKAIMAKVEPNLASIGDVKTIARSLHVIFSLFDPYKFDFITYPQISEKRKREEPDCVKNSYDLDILKNKFRALKVLKNNDGDSGMRTGLLFDALTENFDELPAPNSAEMEELYATMRDKGQVGFVKIKNQVHIEKAPKIQFEADDELPF